MKDFLKYITSFFEGLWSLLIGMKVTIREFFRKKVTEQYPENRATLKMADRFRGTLTLVKDEQGQYKCIACGICQNVCPNQTISLTGEMIETADGKKKKVLTDYRYDLGSCTFCQLCVTSCPHGAIEFDQKFEHAVFTRAKLVLHLNENKTASAAEK